MTAANSRSDTSSAPVGAWLDILLLTARLLARHWPALLFWFFLQRVAYNLSIQAAISVAGLSLLLAYGMIALLVVGQLATGIAVFLCLRPTLPVLSKHDLPQTAGTRSAWLRALAVALLPFFAYYATWGLLDGVRRDFQLRYIFSIPSEHLVPLTDVLNLPWLWLALTSSYVVRRFSLKRAKDADAVGWSLLATACEAYWVFVGARAITQGIGFAKSWWQDRAVHQLLVNWWEDPQALFHLLQPAKQALAPLWDFAATVFGGVVTPLVWLAITAIIYGMDLRRVNRLDGADARFERLSTRYSAMPLLVRKLAGKASEGWTSKGVPIVNSLRLTLRAGLPAVILLCLCFQLLELFDAWAWRSAALIFAAQGAETWSLLEQPLAVLIGTPIGLRPALLTEIVRIALLAATCDSAIAHLRASPAAEPAREAPSAALSTAPTG